MDTLPSKRAAGRKRGKKKKLHALQQMRRMRFAEARQDALREQTPQAADDDPTGAMPWPAVVVAEAQQRGSGMSIRMGEASPRFDRPGLRDRILRLLLRRKSQPLTKRRQRRFISACSGTGDRCTEQAD